MIKDCEPYEIIIKSGSLKLIDTKVKGVVGLTKAFSLFKKKVG